MKTKTEGTKKEKKAKLTGKRIKGVNTFETLDAIVNTPEVGIIPLWALDPARRERLCQLVRARLDFQRIRIAADNRLLSPTPTNKAQLLPTDLQIILLMGDRAREFEEQIKKGVKYILQQSEIGRWLLDQKGLGAGWLAGYILAEFPDIYDARRCNICGQHSHRDMDMVHHHPAPPEKRGAPRAAEGDDDSDGGSSRIRCIHDGKVMDDSNSYVHERKQSSFQMFSGLATVESWACPHCGYGLLWGTKSEHGGQGKGWIHPKHVKKEGPKGCPANGRVFAGGSSDVPVSPVGGQQATSVRRSPKRVPGQKNSYKSQLRSKLVGPKGVADQFVNHHHPKYGPLFEGYVNRVKARDPWRANDAGWIRQMGLRVVANQFVIDFFTVWRKSEGLPCRPPYAEEKLGIVHHP